MNRISNTKCDVCLRRGVQTKTRTICNECREFLCKECSDTHLLHRSSMNHNLIDLDLPGDKEPRSANEDELASDFLEHVTVSETTVLYRAQVAVEGGAGSKDQSKSTQKGKTKVEHDDVDISKITAKKVCEFSVSRPDNEGKVYVTGVLTLRDKIVIVDEGVRKLKLFDRSENFLSSTDINDSPWGITRINGDQFATCGTDTKVLLWSVRGQTIISEDKTYDVDHNANGIHYNGTYYCVLHCGDNAVIKLDRQGRSVRKIVTKKAFGKEIQFGRDIHMDSDKHNIYVPCWSPFGVLCMSVEGVALWFTSLCYRPWGITSIQGVLCLADIAGKCFHLISKTGQYMKKLPEKERLDGMPQHIYYDEEDH